MELFIIFITILLDQISKIYIESNVALHGHIEVIPDFFYITYVRNTGAAWSLFAGKVPFLVIVSIIEICFIAVVLYRMKRQRRTWYRISLSLMLGGAIGNLIDRIALGSVRDFLHFYPLGYDFPVFNIADCAITVGMGIVIVLMLLDEKKEASA